MYRIARILFDRGDGKQIIRDKTTFAIDTIRLPAIIRVYTYYVSTILQISHLNSIDRAAENSTREHNTQYTRAHTHAYYYTHIYT